LKQELAAIDSMGGQRFRPFTQSAAAAAVEVLDACGQWPPPPPFNDDGRLEIAIGRLIDHLQQLSALARGERAETPDADGGYGRATDADPNEPSDADVWFAQHCALINEARPWLRVETRDFDPDRRRDR